MEHDRERCSLKAELFLIILDFFKVSTVNDLINARGVY